MKRRLGILTFHNVPNYGAILQAYALRSYLRDAADADVSILDFQCKGNSDGFEPSKYFEEFSRSGSKLKHIVKKTLVKLFAAGDYKKKYRAFKDFSEKHLNVSPYDGETYRIYEHIFCGSDQIWNGGITDGLQPPYFGADRPKDARTRVSSYAASCGDIKELDKKAKKELFDRVRALDNVGVREKSLADALAAEGVDASLNVDPTFLLSKEQYIEGLGLDGDKNGKPFILQYELRKDGSLDAVASRIAREKGLPVVKICGYMRLSPEKGIFSAGPQEFMQLLCSAEYVVTNSFHGTALSLIFEKDFSVVLPQSRKGRVTDLLSSLGLTERICESADKVCAEPVDYAAVKDALSEGIECSRQYIGRILKSEDNKQ